MPVGEVILVRHGQSTWNSERRWAGQADPPLSELGKRQAAVLGRQCRDAKIGAIATSDLSRAQETGLIVSQALDLAPPAALSDLRERWSRTLTGLTADEIDETFPGALTAWRDGTSLDLPGDSETFDAFADRVLRGLRAAAGLAPAVLVVAHAGVIRAVGEVTRAGANAQIENAEGRRIVVGTNGISDNGPAF